MARTPRIGRQLRPEPARRPTWQPVAFILGLGLVVLMLGLPVLDGSLEGATSAASTAPNASAAAGGWHEASIEPGGQVVGMTQGPNGPFGFGLGIWTTTDARHWTFASLADPAAATAGPHSFGSLAFVGTTAVGVDSAGAAWRSTDLATWRPAPAGVGGPGSRISISGPSSGPSFVVVSAKIQTSADGLKWQSVAPPGEPLIAYGRGSGSRAMAIGERSFWRTADGKTWTEVPLPTDHALAVPSDGVVTTSVAVAGACEMGPAGRPVILVAKASGPVAVIPLGEARGCVKDVSATQGLYLAGGWTDAGAAAWTSPDGAAWAPLDPTSSPLSFPPNASFGGDFTLFMVPEASLVIVGIGVMPDGTIVAVGRRSGIFSANGAWWFEPSH
jgi:hypothetical protein